jgi:hypothetical protein
VRVLAEHGQDELRAVEHVGVDRVEDRGDLGRREIVLADGDGSVVLPDRLFQVGHLALAQVGARVGRVPVLDHVGDPIHIRRAKEFLDLTQLLVLAGLSTTPAGNDREHDRARADDRSAGLLTGFSAHRAIFLRCGLLESYPLLDAPDGLFEANVRHCQ